MASKPRVLVLGGEWFINIVLFLSRAQTCNVHIAYASFSLHFDRISLDPPTVLS